MRIILAALITLSAVIPASAGPGDAGPGHNCGYSAEQHTS